MAFAVIMPKAGMSMETGKVVRWLKNVGDPVKTGEPLLEIETDKVTLEVEAEVSGVLIQVISGPGEEVPVTNVIGYIGEPGESVGGQPRGPSAPASPTAASPPSQSVPAASKASPQALLSSQGTLRVAATPLARTLAREAGIDIASVPATSPRGEIRARDVREMRQRESSAAQRQPVAPPAGTPVTLFSQADVTDLETLRTRVNEGLGADTSITDWLVRAVALSVGTCPGIRGRSRELPRDPSDTVNIGVTDTLDPGSPVGVIQNVGSLSVRAISERRHELPGKALAGAPAAGGGSTATLTVARLEGRDILAFTPCLPAAGHASLGAGRVMDSLRLVDGAVVQQKVLSVSLTINAQLIDADQAVQFLETVVLYLANPAALLA